MKTFTNNTKRYLAFCMLILSSICIMKAQTFNPLLAAKLQNTLDSISNLSPNAKGVSAGVYYPGQGVWRGAWGASDSTHPITTDMEFGVASNTKLFVASMMMKLVEDNLLNLNDHIGKWIPVLYNNIDSAISIKQLLNHTSGLADNSLSFFDSVQKYPNHVFTVTEVLSYQAPKVYNPGGGYNYSNTNYMLAGMVAESVTGFHISKLIRDSILTPQLLDSIYYSFKEPVLGTIAHPWVSGVDDTTSRIGLNSASGAAGAIYSTAAYMVKWYNALFSGQVVNANSLAQMTTFTGTGNYGYALEKRVVLGRTTWGHGGKTLGYLSEMFYDPALKASVCGISNSDQASVAGTSFLLLKTLIDYLPDTAKAITGTKTVCQGYNSITYTVPAIARATSYTWTLPNGVTGSSITNSITVNYTLSAVSGNITVCGNNQYGSSSVSSTSITVYIKPTVPAITSINTINNSGFTVNWNAVSNASYYLLDIATNASFSNIVSGYNNLNVAATFKAVTGLNAGTNYYARVRAANISCVTSSSSIVMSTTICNPPVLSSTNSITLTSFVINWVSSVGATSYLLDVATDSLFNNILSNYNGLSVVGTNKTISGLNMGTKYFYRLRAVNTVGNSSNSITGIETTLSNTTSLQLTAFLEGLYLGSNTMIASPRSADGLSPSNLADTITVELHQTSGSYLLAYTSKAMLGTNGLCNVTFPSAANGNSYYITVKHRNSIEIWSALPVAFSSSGNAYNFSSALNQAYGSNLKNNGGGIFLIYSGDINQDGSVDFNDYPTLDLASSNGVLGYNTNDLNGDASVDFNDYPSIDINSSNGIIKMTP